MSKNGLWDRARLFIKKIDPSSWPAFIMFGVVLFAAGGLNYVNMIKTVGSWIALAIALFFGAGVLSWHIVESRTDDSKFQEDVAQTVKWLNVILDFVLLTINLFRAEYDGISNYTTWAYLIIGISAGSHVVGFLFWTQNDPRRMQRKELDRSLSDLDFKAGRANIQIQKTEQHMAKVKWINDESIRLRALYEGIPDIDVDGMITEMKTAALKEFADVKPQDMEKTTSNKPIQRLQTANQYHQVENPIPPPRKD